MFLELLAGLIFLRFLEEKLNLYEERKKSGIFSPSVTIATTKHKKKHKKTSHWFDFAGDICWPA